LHTHTLCSAPCNLYSLLLKRMKVRQKLDASFAVRLPPFRESASPRPSDAPLRACLPAARSKRPAPRIYLPSARSSAPSYIPTANRSVSPSRSAAALLPAPRSRHLRFFFPEFRYRLPPPRVRPRSAPVCPTLPQSRVRPARCALLLRALPQLLVAPNLAFVLSLRASESLVAQTLTAAIVHRHSSSTPWPPFKPPLPCRRLRRRPGEGDPVAMAASSTATAQNRTVSLHHGR
jgi:hypothetical protein